VLTAGTKVLTRADEYRLRAKKCADLADCRSARAAISAGCVPRTPSCRRDRGYRPGRIVHEQTAVAARSMTEINIRFGPLCGLSRNAQTTVNVRKSGSLAVKLFS
jgi:hypothetical protein